MYALSISIAWKLGRSFDEKMDAACQIGISGGGVDFK